MSSRAKNVYPQIIGVDFNIHIFSFRKYCNS